MNKRILLCIKIFGVFYIISGVAPFINIILNIFTSLTESVTNISIYSPLVGILCIFIGYGLLKREQWARMGAIVFSYFAIFASIFLFFLNVHVTKLAIGFMVGIIQIYFFNRQSVKEQFKLIKL